LKSGGTIKRIVGLRSPTQANSSRASISPITKPKQIGQLVLSVKCLFCEFEALSSNPSPPTKKLLLLKSTDSLLGPTN
jgi:hypothetical protein